MVGNAGQNLHASGIKDHQYITLRRNLHKNIQYLPLSCIQCSKAEILCNQAVIPFRHSFETLLHFMEIDTILQHMFFLTLMASQEKLRTKHSFLLKQEETSDIMSPFL